MPRSGRFIILRHGKADWDSRAPDFDRPLAPRGEQDAPRVGAWLRQQGWVPDRVVSSPAARAIATAELACDGLGFPPGRVEKDPRIYLAGVSDLVTVLDGHLGAAVMLVGHNPGLENLVRHLCDDVEEPTYGELLPPAAAACIEDGRLVLLRRPAQT